MNLKDDASIDSLAELISGCKRNERLAQMRLYKRFAKPMFNSCIRIVSNSVLAEDIVQESFIKAFLHIASYNGEVPFDAWLRRIVINQSIDELRKKKIQWTELHENLSYQIEDFDDLQKLTIQENLIRNIKQHIKNLPDGYRIILSLYFFEGYDHEEIGQILNVSASTSRSQLTRAKRKLIELVNKDTDE